jgi:hypothetical protein
MIGPTMARSLGGGSARLLSPVRILVLALGALLIGLPLRTGVSAVPGTPDPGADQAVRVFLPVASRPDLSWRNGSDLHAACLKYPHIASTELNHCRLCHVMDDRFKMNPYGRDYKRAGRDFVAVEPLDSDGDGFTNLTEILAITFPGLADSHPRAAP